MCAHSTRQRASTRSLALVSHTGSFSINTWPIACGRHCALETRLNTKATTEMVFVIWLIFISNSVCAARYMRTRRVRFFYTFSLLVPLFRRVSLLSLTDSAHISIIFVRNWTRNETRRSEMWKKSRYLRSQFLPARFNHVNSAPQAHGISRFFFYFVRSFAIRSVCTEYRGHAIPI